MKTICFKNKKIGNREPLAVICGPCVIESEELTLRMAEDLKKIFEPFPFTLIFKASYDKANRSSLHSFRGPGLEKGLKILEKVQKNFDLPILTDVHSQEEAKTAGSLCDIIQIPAFLCRQTDLLIAAASTPAAINVKKGQFVAPWDMKNVIEKLTESGKQDILLTDRGTCFGYNNLVADLRSIPIMQTLGFPVCFDATHSVQLPGGLGKQSGGERDFAPLLARAAVAAGANALFLEVHPRPEEAKSDASTVLPYPMLQRLLLQTAKIYEALACDGAFSF